MGIVSPLEVGMVPTLEVGKAPLEGGRKAPPLVVGMQKSVLDVEEGDGQMMLGAVIAEVYFY